jgi:ferredoxin
MTQALPDSQNLEPSGAPPAIVMRLRGRRYTVEYRAGETLLETARRAQVPIGSTCEMGNCGACVVTVIQGRVAMRANNVLSQPDIAAGLALACQSVATGNVLEVDLG